MESLPPLVSIIIPVKDEGENILSLAEEISSVLAPQGWGWECVWVNDGSQDDTLPQLRSLHTRDPRHTYVSFERNHGQTAVLVAWLAHGSGTHLGHYGWRWAEQPC